MTIKLGPALTKIETPVFNTHEIDRYFGGESGTELLLDSQGLNRSLETILPAGTPIMLAEKIQNTAMIRIQIDSHIYPCQGSLFIDKQFLEASEEANFIKTPQLPSAAEIIKRLENMPHFPYVWGGNVLNGISMMKKYYREKDAFSQLDEKSQKLWLLQGMDCSGLLYFVTNGHTPRNTSELIHYGKTVSIQNCKTAEEISIFLKPLDLIVWKGHVVCVLNKTTAIESRNPNGLVRSNLVERIEEVLKTRKPVDIYQNNGTMQFVVRRWHPEQMNIIV